MGHGGKSLWRKLRWAVLFVAVGLVLVMAGILGPVIWLVGTRSGNEWACTQASTSGIDCSKFSSTSTPSSVPPGGNLTLDEGTNTTRTIACNDGHLTVDGMSMTVTVTGHCVRLTVDGIGNHVTVDAVDAIDAEGADNVVTFHSGSPHITKKLGVGNTVQQG